MAGYFSNNTTSSSSEEDTLSIRLPGLNLKPSYCFNPSDPAPDDTVLSLLYTTLPNILQRRMPKIRSIRASLYTPPKTQLRSRSVSSTASTSSESPPPSYRTRPSSSASDNETEEDSDSDLHDLFTSAPSSRPSTSGSATPAPLLPAFTRQDQQQLPQDEQHPTISTKSAQHGLALLNLSMRHSPASNDPLNRRLYIDGISYILRGLPSDLTEEEALVLREAAPQTLHPPKTQLVHQPNTASHTTAQQPRSQAQQAPTLLHRTTSHLTYALILLTTLLLPHLQTLLTTLHNLNVQHRLAARFTAQTSLLFRALIAQLLALMVLVWDANDGALRHACRDFGVWVIRDVCGGVDEGVGRAVGRLGLEGREGKGGEGDGV